MKNIQKNQEGAPQFIKGYRIERNYGNESMKSCMVQIIRMVVAQNMHKEEKVVL